MKKGRRDGHPSCLFGLAKPCYGVVETKFTAPSGSPFTNVRGVGLLVQDLPYLVAVDV
jgi:hypothetical protein